MLNPALLSRYAPPPAVAVPSIAFRAVKTGRFTADNNFHLGEVTTSLEGFGAVLDFAAGNLLLLFSYRRHYGTTGTSAAVSAGASGGWNYFGFQGTSAVEDACGIIGAWKIASGSETSLDLLTAAGAGGTVTHGIRSYALAYNIVGATVTLSTPVSQITSGDPTLQTIAASGATPPVLCFSFAAGTTQPDQTFDSQTPDHTISEGLSGGTAGFVRLKTKLFTASPADITTNAADLGNDNACLSGYISVGL